MNEYMHSDSVNTSHSAIAGVSMFLAGAALGAATALVWAPAAGRDTRAFLRRRSNEVAHDAVTRGRDALRTQSDRMTSVFTDSWRRAGDAFRHTREYAREYAPE